MRHDCGRLRQEAEKVDRLDVCRGLSHVPSKGLAPIKPDGYGPRETACYLACLATSWFVAPYLLRKDTAPLAPNATLQVREIAGARNERTLFPVTCKRLLGLGW